VKIVTQRQMHLIKNTQEFFSSLQEEE